VLTDQYAICKADSCGPKNHVLDGWLVEKLTSPFSTKLGYIGDKVLGGDLVLPG